MFNFAARFLRVAETPETTPAIGELNGFTVIPLDSFVKSGSTHKRADKAGTAPAKDKKDKDDKSKDKAKDKKEDKSKEKLTERPKDKPKADTPEFGLGAPHRPAGDQEMRDYLTRIKDKTKTKLDPYTMPYVHGGSIKIVDGGGKEFDLDALRATIKKRPSKLLKQNEKMQHSDGTATQFYNIGLPALKGLAVNEGTGEFVIVDTCPGSGSCKTFCYAMKGSYIMFKDVSMTQTQTLNFLLNHPDKFKARLKAEIALAITNNEDIKVVIRWHDAGDFFSPQYMDLAFDVARAFPENDFYAYTKMGAVANAKKPANFKISFSDGALPSETKKVNFSQIKHSVVVPKEMFFDLIAREGRHIIKDNGQVAFKSKAAWDEFKDKLVAKYHIDKKTILSFNEYMDRQSKDKLGDTPHYWNVVVPPGGGDNSSNDNLVLGSYLMFH